MKIPEYPVCKPIWARAQAKSAALAKAYAAGESKDLRFNASQGTIGGRGTASAVTLTASANGGFSPGGTGQSERDNHHRLARGQFARDMR